MIPAQPESRPEHDAFSTCDVDLAERHVEEGTTRVAAQERRIAHLRARGCSTDLAASLLTTMQITLAAMTDHRDRIAEPSTVTRIIE